MQRLRKSKFWRERTAREQQLLAAATGVLVVAVVFLALIEPAIDGRHHWQHALPQLRAERAQMQSLAKQLHSDAAPAAAEARAIDRASLERSLADTGLKAASVEVSNGLIRARWSDVSFSTLNKWLQRMQHEQGWSVVEASVSARDHVDRVDVTISLKFLRSSP
jgi:general secretion pathway protein M